VATKYQKNQAQEAIKLMEQAQNSINAGDRDQADQFAQQAYAAAQRSSNASVAAAVVNHANQFPVIQPAVPEPTAQPQPAPQQSGGSSPSPSYSPQPAYSPAPPPPPPPPKPPAWIFTSEFRPPAGIKQAEPDIILSSNDAISAEFMIQTTYEDLSGMELINTSRSDIINGVDVVYSPIKNLSLLRRKYNPNNIIAMSETSSSYFSRFGIDLILRGAGKPFFDEEGNVVIEVDKILEDELIEVEISDSGIINEVEFI
jgi:hypothetical protein